MKTSGKHGMELSDSCMLSEGEEIIFDDGNVGYDKKLVLTNKRLIFLQVKGIFKKTYQKEDEIPINDIESARYETESGTLLLQLKNGEKEIIELYPDSTDLIMGTSSADILDMRLQATIDRWVNEINRLAAKASGMIYCKYCSAKNKSTEIKCVNCGALLS